MSVDSTLGPPSLVCLDTKTHPTGDLTVVEADDIGFLFARAYFLHNLSEGSVRGSHAHRRLSQLLIPVSGTFTVETEYRGIHASFLLDNPSEGLLIRPLTWRTLVGFSSGAVCLVLASSAYSELDYIREYEEFVLESGL